MASVPTIELFKDGCRIVANVSDAKQFTAKGWAPKPTEPDPEPSIDTTDPPGTTPPAGRRRKA
jgi:hypothetical protein